jgi:SAM-dependent methyltransferase
VLQEFRPLTRCLEWELSELHWNQQGILPFVENDVPFLINNSGRLSEHAAALLFANCLETLGAGSIRVLELGAGTGLFARYFLNAFRAICLQENRDFYQRLIYYVTDRSMRTVQQWQGKFSLTAGKPACIKIILDDFQYLTKYPWVTYLQLMSNYVAGT